ADERGQSDENFLMFGSKHDPPASTLPLFVGDVSALPRASLRTVQPVGSSVHHPFLASQSTGFVVI
ncbi:MAG: hypothetical protein DWC05_03495, partial [Candidatus Poseidoniales archaeon]